MEILTRVPRITCVLLGGTTAWKYYFLNPFYRVELLHGNTILLPIGALATGLALDSEP
jgi:hypothetical protein